MKSNITFSKEDEDLLLVTMKFSFAESRGPVLRKRLAAQYYKLSPMDKTKIPVAEFVLLTGEANTSIHNEFVIQRTYEISQDYEQNVALAQAHAEKYFQRVINDLKDIA